MQLYGMFFCFAGLAEFAPRTARINSNPFFAAACTPQKTLCAESEYRTPTYG